MSSKLLTVVTVVYNAEDLIEETIKSVIYQTAFENIEYLVIDGASTDNTMSIVKNYADKIDVLVSEPDKGIYHAMNKAIDLATGKWINFMNAGDTFVSPTTVDQCLNAISETTDVLYGNFYYVKNNNKELLKCEIKNIYTDIALNHQSMLYRTSILKKYKYNESYKIVADCDLNLKLYSNGYKFQYINIPIANFLAGGLNSQYRISTLIEFLFSLNVYIPKEKDIKKSLVFHELLQESSLNLSYKSLVKQNGPTELKELNHRIKELANIKFYKHPLVKYTKSCYSITVK